MTATFKASLSKNYITSYSIKGLKQCKLWKPNEGMQKAKTKMCKNIGGIKPASCLLSMFVFFLTKHQSKSHCKNI